MVVMKKDNNVYEMNNKEWNRYEKVVEDIAKTETKVSELNAKLQKLYVELFKIERGNKGE